MSSDKDSKNDETTRERAAHAKYQPPRVVKSRRLAEVTGQGAVVPSGAPRPVVD